MEFLASKHLLRDSAFLAPVAPLKFVASGHFSLVLETASGYMLRVTSDPECRSRHLMEVRTLPLISAAIPLAVPLPRDVSSAGAGPGTVIAYRKLPGQRPDASPTNAQRSRLAVDLASVLVNLHTTSIAALSALVTSTAANPMRGTPIHRAGRLFRVIAPTLRLSLSRSQFAATTQWLNSFVADRAMLDFIPCIRHGDLWDGNMLVDAEGKLTGLLDWEWLSIGDPASDLAVIKDVDGGFYDVLLDHYSTAIGGGTPAQLRHRVARLVELRRLEDLAFSLTSGQSLAAEAAIDRLRGSAILTGASPYLRSRGGGGAP